MNRIKQKLASCTGASLVLALVAMAICITVGASILMSASAAVDSAKNRESEEAARFAVSSAAGVVRKAFESDDADLIYTKEKNVCRVTGYVDDTADSTPNVANPGEPVEDGLCELIKKTTKNANGIVDGYSSTCEIELDKGTNSVSCVTVDILVKEETDTIPEASFTIYTAEASLYVKDENNNKLYEVTLFFKGTQTEEIRHTSGTCKCTGGETHSADIEFTDKHISWKLDGVA